MKKTLFFAMLMALGFGVASCDSDSDEPNWDLYEDVEIDLGTNKEQSWKPEGDRTRTLVTPTGATSWDNDDQVMIIDVNGVAKPFIYDSNRGMPRGRFVGKLLGGQGLKTYYSYHKPLSAPCVLSNYILTVGRKDIDILQNGEIRSTMFGEYCPMVGVPSKFDIENGNKSVEFHHAAALIEGSISCKDDDSDCFKDVNYDKVVFTVEARNGAKPFNKEVSIDLRSVTGKPDNDVSIPFTEGNEKVDRLVTSIEYTKETPNLNHQIQTAESGRYNFPIFALPTKDKFYFKATIEFYLKGELVCLLVGPDTAYFDGLNPAGLNVLSFTTDHRKDGV